MVWLTEGGGPGKDKAVVPWLNWIEQPPPKGQVTGSNPVGITTGLTFPPHNRREFVLRR